MRKLAHLPFVKAYGEFKYEVTFNDLGILYFLHISNEDFLLRATASKDTDKPSYKGTVYYKDKRSLVIIQ